MAKNGKRTLQDLNLCDDYLFSAVMRDEEICKLVIEKILDIKIKRVKFLEPQVERRPVYGAHGIEMDIFLDDGKGSVFAVEMQASNEYNTKKRSRYIHSIVDADALLKTGADYKNLKRNYVIFICTFDEFQEGRHIYTFEGRCEQDTNIRLGDDAYTVFLNTEGTAEDVDEEMLSFLRYIKESSEVVATEANSNLIDRIHRRVETIRASQEEGVKFMKFEELMKRNHDKGYDEGRQEGISVGIEKGRLDELQALVAEGFLTEQQAAERLSISLEEFRKRVGQVHEV